MKIFYHKEGIFYDIFSSSIFYFCCIALYVELARLESSKYINCLLPFSEDNKKLKPNNFKSENYRREKYNPDIMKFAMTLQGYSSQSYKFVREVFSKSLPSIQTIRNYVSKLGKASKKYTKKRTGP